MKKGKNIISVRCRIEKNYSFIKRLEKYISFQETDLDKLELISVIAKMYSEYVTGVYSSEFLENEIIKIGKRNIVFKPKRKAVTGRMLHVMTKSAWIGGHSVIVNNWINWDYTNSYSLVFTNMEYMDIPDFLIESVKKSGGKIYCLHGNYIEKAKELLEISQDYQRVIMSIHMEDVVPILAFSNRNFNIPVYFYNHADFRFSLGFSIADAVFNLCTYDKKKTKIYRGITEVPNLILEFPGSGKLERKEIDKIELKKKLINKYNIDATKKIVVSMGDDFKYENIFGFEFDVFARQLIEKCNNKAAMYIVGADKKREKWIELEKRSFGNVRAMGILPREDAEGLIQIADLYIVSFPMMASGTMVAEMASVPYLALHVINRGKERYGISSAKTVGELLDKSVDALFVNSNKYYGNFKRDMLDKENWISRWNDICNLVNKHNLHKFQSNRLVKRQEYVNCQLMQENAAKNVRLFLKTEMQNYKNIKKIFILSKVLDMGIFTLEKRNPFESLYGDYKEEVKLSTKYYRMYLLGIRWLKLYLDGKSISEYLHKKNYKSVAIYGMGYIGKVLATDLENGHVQVMCGIDRNAKDIHAKIKIQPPNYEINNIDLIINTTNVTNNEVRKELTNKDVNIISFERLLDEI